MIKSETVVVAVRIPIGLANRIDEKITKGDFVNRSDVIKNAIRNCLKQEIGKA